MSVFSDLLNGVLQIDRESDVIEHGGKWYNWGQLADTIADLRAALAKLNLGRDSRVGVMVRNRPSPFAAILTAVSTEACMVSINPLLPDERLVKDIEGLRLPVVIAEQGDLDRPGVLDALRKAGSAVIALEGQLAGAHILDGFDKPGPDVRLEEPGVIIEMLTSGTTGAPKRIPLKRTAFDKSFVGALSYEKGRNPDDPAKLRSGVMILSNPMTHIGGLWAGLTCIAGGRKGCMLEKFSVATWHDAVRRHRPKVAGAVPAALRMILDANIPKEDLSSLVAVRTGAAPLDPEIANEFLERYDIPVLQNYGATEFSGAVAGWELKDFRQYWKDKHGSVGRFQPGVEGRVVDQETGEILPAGQEGVLEMRAAQFSNGGEWLRTTDRAEIDEDGFLFIRGRADLAIIRGGFKVHPDDVNKTYEQHPAIREAVTVGIKDRRLGAVPVMAIMLKSGAAAPSAEELTAFGKEHLMPYQVPVKFLILDEVPRTPSMKPALPQVRELFADMMADEA
ncbi:class I adenylate-forming enzyme family protein [Sphingobium sp. Sx8-8]|uniref:class I adenylate-forming enzyme family protein n=1 Tax=Sphingobium sp. Sx8-8 TaxID=2933617 RepID=UPI001F5A798B|nr:class I adenylate-forming enzyme family protein [Sphingobium sp. Sx8-8]